MVDRTQSDGLNGNSFKIHAAGNNVMTTLLFLFVLLTRTDRQTDRHTNASNVFFNEAFDWEEEGEEPFSSSRFVFLFVFFI